MMDRTKSQLLVIDFQSRLMPAIRDGSAILAKAQKLIETARILGIPLRFTEQYPKGLGHTVADVAPRNDEPILEKTYFSATRAPGFEMFLAGASDVVVIGCEAHVCVLQTVLGMLEKGQRVFVVSDAIGSRNKDNHRAALDRMNRHGAEIVTTEMVMFEWLETAEHPAFRQISALIK